MQDITVEQADLSDAGQASDVLMLLDEYSEHPLGQGRPLDKAVRERVIADLNDEPSAMVFLALCGGSAVGLAICFRGYSTFTGRPRINIHDLVVTEAYRGRGVGRSMLEHIGEVARGMGCSGVTLEVRCDNTPARRLYESVGFRGIADGSPASSYLFGTWKL